MATTQESATGARAHTGAGLTRGRPALALRALGHLRGPNRSSFEFAAKAAVSTTLAIWLGQRIGLSQSYWAGISAVVATAGTLGASLGAAFSRISATVVGLLIGLAAFAMPVSGVLVSGATVFVALAVLPALSLDAGARLGAASTLIVTALPAHSAVGDALARGANVPLGCTVAVVVGLVLLPHRAADRLRAGLRMDIACAGELVRSAVLAYLGAGVADDLPGRLEELARTSSAHAAVLRDAAREPGERGERLERLTRRVEAVRALVDEVGSVVGAAIQAGDDTAYALVATELEAAARSLADAAHAVASPSQDGEPEGSLQGADGALSDLDRAFAGVRDRRATVDYRTDDVTRLLSVMRSVHAAGSALRDLAD